MTFHANVRCRSVLELLAWTTGSSYFSLSLRATSVHTELVLWVLIEDREYTVTTQAPELTGLLSVRPDSSAGVNRQVSVAAVTTGLEAHARRTECLAHGS